MRKQKYLGWDELTQSGVSKYDEVQLLLLVKGNVFAFGISPIKGVGTFWVTFKWEFLLMRVSLD